MSLGKREAARQQEFWTPTAQLSRGPGHVFYDMLNQVLAKAGFDKTLERLCEPYYAKTSRSSIPPGVYFRMLLIGYLEGIDSQRGIAGGAGTVSRCEAFWGWLSRSRLPTTAHSPAFVIACC